MTNFFLCKCGRVFSNLDDTTDHLTCSALFGLEGHAIQYHDGDTKINQEIIATIVDYNLNFLGQRLKFNEMQQPKKENAVDSNVLVDAMLKALMKGTK